MTRPTIPLALGLSVVLVGCGGATPAVVTHAPGARPSEPARREHQHLLHRITAAEQAAARIPTAPPDQAEVHVREVLRFFDEVLAPHAAAEEEVLYAVADRHVPTPAPHRWTDSLRHEHTVVHAAIATLHRLAGDPSPEARAELARLAVSTLGLVRGHFSAEEEVVLAALDRVMTAAEFRTEVMLPTEARVHHPGHAHAGHAPAGHAPAP